MFKLKPLEPLLVGTLIAAFSVESSIYARQLFDNNRTSLEYEPTKEEIAKKEQELLNRIESQEDEIFAVRSIQENTQAYLKRLEMDREVCIASAIQPHSRHLNWASPIRFSKKDILNDCAGKGRNTTQCMLNFDGEYDKQDELYEIILCNKKAIEAIDNLPNQ